MSVEEKLCMNLYGVGNAGHRDVVLWEKLNTLASHILNRKNYHIGTSGHERFLKSFNPESLIIAAEVLSD